jgi:hypothetical protein
VEVKESAIRPNNAQRAGATKTRNKSLRTDSGSFRLECCPKDFLEGVQAEQPNQTIN